MGDLRAAFDCVFELRIKSYRFSSSERGLDELDTGFAPRFSSAGRFKRAIESVRCRGEDVDVEAVCFEETDAFLDRWLKSPSARDAGRDCGGRFSSSETYTPESRSWD